MKIATPLLGFLGAIGALIVSIEALGGQGLATAPLARTWTLWTDLILALVGLAGVVICLKRLPLGSALMTVAGLGIVIATPVAAGPLLVAGGVIGLLGSKAEPLDRPSPQA